uniref:Uncharacterized protein n=1 Tax=Cacopsylla melanoneura TaxID=428564 RepID=A0A8D8XDG5_9HEMI
MYLLSDGKLENPEESLLSELVNPEESLLSDGKLENPEESTQFRGDLQLMTPKEDKEIEDFIDKQNKDTTEVIELAQNLDDLKERLKGFEADRKLKEKALAEVVQKKEIGVLASEDHAKREAEENERKRKEEDERKKIEEKLRQENERKRREAELDEEIERKRKEAELKEEIERKRREKELQEEQVRKEKELIESQQREKEIEEENNRKLREQEVLDKKLKEEEARKLMEQEAKDIEKRRQLDFIERERKENELLLSQAKEVQFPDVSDAHVQTIPSNKEDTMVQTIPFGSEHTMVQTAPLSLKQTQTSFTSQEKQEEVQHKPVQTEKEDEPDKAHKYTEKKSKKSPKTSKDKAVSSQKGVKTETTTTDAIKVETDVLKQVPVITEIVDDTVTLIVDTTVSKSPEQIVGEKVQAEKDPKTKKSLQRSDRVQETYTLEKVTQAPSVDDKSVEPSEKVTSTPDTSHTDETVPAKNEANGVKVAAPKSSKNKDVPASKEKDTPSKKKSPKKQKSDQSVSSDISVDSKGKQKPHLLEKVSKYFSKSSKKKSKESPSSSFEEYKSQDLSISDSVQSKVPESDTPIKSSDLDLEQVSAVEVALKVNVKDSDEPQTPSTTEEKVDIRTDSTPSVEEKVTEKPVSTIKQTQTSFSSQEQDELNKQNLQHPGRTTTLPTQTSETPIDVSDDTSSGKPQYNVEAEVRLDKQTKRPKKPTDKKKDVTSSTVLESKPAAEIGSSNVSSTDDLTNTDELKINITAQIDTKDSEDSKLQDSDVDRPEVQKTSAKITKKIFGVFKKQKDVPSEKSAKQKESSPTPTEKLSESSPTKDTDGKKDFHDVLQKGKKLSKALLKKAVDPRLHESPEEQSYSVTTPLTLDDGVVQIEEVTADVPESSVSTVNIQTTPGQDTFQQVSTQVVTYPEKDFETTVRSIKSGTTYQISEGVSRSLVTKSVIQQTSTSSSDFDDKSKPIIEILPSETTYQISDDGTTRSIITKSVTQQTSSDLDNTSKPISEMLPSESSYQISDDGTTKSIITKSVIQQTSTSSSDLDNTSKPIIEMASIDLSDPLLTRVESVTSTQVHDPDVSSVNVQSTFETKSGVWVSKSSSTFTSRKVTKTVIKSSKTVNITQDDFNKPLEDVAVRTSSITRVSGVRTVKIGERVISVKSSKESTDSDNDGVTITEITSDSEDDPKPSLNLGESVIKQTQTQDPHSRSDSSSQVFTNIVRSERVINFTSGSDEKPVQEKEPKDTVDNLEKVSQEGSNETDKYKTMKDFLSYEKTNPSILEPKSVQTSFEEGSGSSIPVERVVNIDATVTIPKSAATTTSDDSIKSKSKKKDKRAKPNEPDEGNINATDNAHPIVQSPKSSSSEKPKAKRSETKLETTVAKNIPKTPVDIKSDKDIESVSVEASVQITDKDKGDKKTVGKNKKSKKVAFLDIKPDEEIKITSEVPTETYSESPKESIVEVKLDLNVPDTSISTKSEETPTLDIKRESVETVTVFEPKAVQTSFSEGSEDAPVDTSVPSVTVPQVLKTKPQDKKSQVTDTKKPTKESEDVSKPRSERKSQEKEKSPSDQEPKLPTSDVQVIKTFEEETRTFSPEDTIEIASVVVDTIIQVSEDSLRADRKKKANKGKENGRDKVSKEDSFKTKLPEDSQFSTLTKHDIDSIGVNVEIVTKVDPKPEGKSKDETDQSSGSKPRKSKSPEDRSGKKPETSTPSVKTEIPPTPSVRSSKKTKKGGEEIPESVKKSDVPTVKNISNVPQTPHTKGEKEISPENNKPDKTRAEKNKKTSKDIVQESKEEILPQEAIGTDRYKITNEFLNIEKVNRDYEPKEVQTSFSDEPSGIDEPSKKKVTIIDESEQTQESKGPTAKDKKSKADKKSKGEKEKTSKSSGEPVDQTDKFPSHKKSDTIKEKPKKPEEVSGDDKQLSKKEKSKSPEKSAEQTVKDASQKKLDTHKEKPLKPKAIDINEKQSHKVQKSKPSDDVHPVVATQTSLPDYSETIPDKSITTFTSEVVVTQNVKKRDDRQSPKNKKKKKSFLKIFFFALRIEFVVVVC